MSQQTNVVLFNGTFSLYNLFTVKKSLDVAWISHYHKSPPHPHPPISTPLRHKVTTVLFYARFQNLSITLHSSGKWWKQWHSTIHYLQWNVTKCIYYTVHIWGSELEHSLNCTFILLFHYISEANIVPFMPLLLFTSSPSSGNNVSICGGFSVLQINWRTKRSFMGLDNCPS